ncbi:MAG: peroxiredoxin [Candidatus Gastranaerophilales bacterium]|nr:peroxiredoxin [Candidatus Gastranaerophilales bacterium]
MIKKFVLMLSAITAMCLISKAYSMPVIGEDAPAFKANTTRGIIDFPHDFKGNWVVLFSHPADFTPVCTTEFIAFQELINKFNALNTKLVGLSVDSVEHHKEWIKSIKNLSFDNKNDIEITFPVIDDNKKEVAKKYGMLQNNNNDTKTVRAVFIIDPESKIRAIIYYPQSTGRYMPEIQRLLIALQTTDAFDVATPANWMPGDDVIVPLNENLESRTSQELKEQGITKHSPYLYTKKLDKGTICDKIFK